MDAGTVYQYAAALLEVPVTAIPSWWRSGRLGEDPLDDATTRVEAVMHAALHDAGAGRLDWSRLRFHFSPLVDGEITGIAYYEVRPGLDIVILVVDLAIANVLGDADVAEAASLACTQAGDRLRKMCAFLDVEPRSAALHPWRRPRVRS